jgi:UDP-N-acetylglucosamine:LPS N-acetylglucosamine transferase
LAWTVIQAPPLDIHKTLHHDAWVARDGLPRVDLLLVCSTGGHLLQLLALREAWEDETRVWVTFSKSDARTLLRDERVVAAYGPTSRSFGATAALNTLRNLLLAMRVVRRTQPAVILTTGAGVAVPFAWVGRAFGARVVYVESFTRIEGPSLSCRLIAPVAARIYGQWPEFVRSVPRARYLGNVFSRG